MNGLRILVLTNLYPPHHLGGYELSCRDVVARWHARGHHVEILTTNMRLPDVVEHADERDRGIRRELTMYWDDYRVVTPSLLGRFRTEQANQRALCRALDEVRPDVVSVWHMSAMSQGLLQTITDRGIPMVFVVCDDWLIYGRGTDMWMRMFDNRRRGGALVGRLTGLPTSVRIDSGAVAFCFVSEWIRKRAVERSAWPLEKTTVVYSGIEPAEFTAPDDEERPWRWKLLSVGRIEERKGFGVAVDALALLPQQATLDLVGPPNRRYLDELMRKASELGVADRLRWVGAVPREELVNHYRAADAFLFPVLWDEPFGLVPLEAMACGTPVVATGTGGSGEFLVDGYNSLIVPPRDAKGLADVLERLARDGTLRQSLIRAGRETVSELDTDVLAETLEEWHRAAATGFRDGLPADRMPLLRGSRPGTLETGPALDHH